MVNEAQAQLSLPDKISIAWFNDFNQAWLELEVTGQRLDWLIFRVLSGREEARCFVPQLHASDNAPDAMEQLWGITISVRDVNRAYQSYARSRDPIGKVKLREG